MLTNYTALLLSTEQPPQQPTSPATNPASNSSPAESFVFERLRFGPDWNEIELDFDEASFSNVPLRVELFDRFGRRTKYWEIPAAPRRDKREGIISLDISSVPDGSYDLSLTHGSNSMVRALVIRRQ